MKTSLLSKLICFELASGPMVNFHKSNIRVLRIDKDTLHNFSCIMNCNIMSIPFTYLGLPIGGNPRKKQLWEPLISKIESKSGNGDI